MKEIFEVNNLQKASKDQGRYYNPRRREWRPAQGSMVLLRQHQLSSASEGFAAKLAPKFDGPYRVVRFISPNVVRLARVGERRRRVANLSQLKPFYTEEEETGGTALSRETEKEEGFDRSKSNMDTPLEE
ncbi:hypothetical protein AWZ03_015504 [Drosophila navojoa]|uniref:Uncharacterized protein n=1 Tax=Drosophila navojoa TaxID=7232 RepID=A0A484AMG3_DRONA|nr:hypothetical protein AWZ03_015504 [Drosophila navojoa]